MSNLANRVKIPLTCCRLLSGLWPEIGKNGRKVDFRLTTRNWQKKGRKMEKWPKNPIFEPFSGDFSHFSALFSPTSLVRRKWHLFRGGKEQPQSPKSALRLPFVSYLARQQYVTSWGRFTAGFSRDYPENLFGLILTSKGYFNFSGYLK